jgi:PAS domain-containing protein
MQAHAIHIKTKLPNAKVVFIGPCIAKKDEADHYGDVDAVLTFEELTKWLETENIKLEKVQTGNIYSKSRFFPTNGGIIKSLNEKLDDYRYLSVDGTENCIEALKDIESGGLHKCFIEMSSCKNSCIGGPVMEKYHNTTPLKDYFEVVNYAGSKDFEVEQLSKEVLHKDFELIKSKKEIPDESEIKTIMTQMGKTKKEDELNCGSCGYNSCREKAIAIYQGKADLSMCLPFLKEKAESFYNNILNNTPTGIIILNEDLEVQQINRAARKIINIRNSSDILGDQVIRILDPKPFLDARDSLRNIYGKRRYLAEYNKYVEQTVIYDRNYRIIMCIMRDVTDEVMEKQNKEVINKHTIEVADKVVEKQMRIVQEIASLLGETAAETKIALTKLKESISND